MIQLKRILCPIDFSTFSERALAFSMKMAARCGAKLEVLHVVPFMPPSTVSPLSAASRELSADKLRAAVDRTRLPGVDVGTRLLESAEPAARILEAAEAFDADVIVTGSHGRSGVARVVLGSVVETLLHQCPRPMLVIPSHCDADAGGKPLQLARIVCAVDFSESSRIAVAYALVIAEGMGARLTLLNVLEPPPIMRRVRLAPGSKPDVGLVRALAEAASLERLQALVPLRAAAGRPIDTVVVEGALLPQLLRMAAGGQADLIVLGVHGRNAFDLAFAGSNSKDVVRQAHCPVLVVPASRRYAPASAAS